MSIEPLEPIGGVDRVEPVTSIDTTWGIAAIDPVGGPGPIDAITAPEGPQPPPAPQRDARAEALNIAQHATMFIPSPFVRLPESDWWKRRR